MRKKRLRYISLLLFFTFIINLCIPCLSVQAEAMPLPDSSEFVASFRDIAGHWAEKGIIAWTARGLVCGYPDGTFRPDSPITRAEFGTLVNRVFGYSNVANTMADNGDGAVVGQGIGTAIYRDVAATDWFAGEFANAAAVGYLDGYPDGTVKPQNPITRQEVAAVLARILPCTVVSEDINDDGSFTDQAQIPEWSQAAIAAAVSGGYMNGYPDGTFDPAKPITRAEAVAVLERSYITIPVHTDPFREQ